MGYVLDILIIVLWVAVAVVGVLWYMSEKKKKQQVKKIGSKRIKR